LFSSEATRSAQVTLSLALDTLLRLFAPVLPFVTEEVWSWWRTGSIHRAPWPTAEHLRECGGDPELLDVAGSVIATVRKAKSDAKLSMRSDVAKLVIDADAETLKRIEAISADVRAAGRVADLELGAGQVVELTVAVEL
jgi:valyl-tRNA synthetase